jgi:archaemetzincin
LILGSTDRKRDSTLRTRYDRTTGHSQIYVESVLNILKRSVPSDAHCLVAITLHDFYSDESDLFIAGLAHGNCHVAAFSFFRYDPRLELSEEFWYDWRLKKSKSKTMATIILLRSCRLLTHEIGHLLGIDHCIYHGCLMNGSGHLEEDFSQPLFLCPVDLRKLFRLVEFDVVHRYEQMLEFCTENQFEDESDLLKKRLEILKKANPIKKKKPLENEEKQKSKRLKRK